MKREHFIPFEKELIRDRLLEDQDFAPADKPLFKKLFEILEHYYHYEAFVLNKKLRAHYAPFDPDRETALERGSGAKNHDAFKKNLMDVLVRANYRPVEESVLRRALKNSGLVGLKLAIPFRDFDEYFICVRGEEKAVEKVPRLWILKKEIEIEYYDRVMICLRYKPAAHFENRKKKSELLFKPGTTVIKLFKRVPKDDLEIVFPNAVPQMSNLDKILLWGPGIGGGIPIITAKILPTLGLVASTLIAGGALSSGNWERAILPAVVALGILGGYLFRQYNGYLAKKIRFAKQLADSLYFKNLGNNAGAFHELLDASEEEELKEALLGYAFLHLSKKPLRAVELDTMIEAYLREKLSVDLDFDVEDALEKLSRIGLGKKSGGKWRVLPLKKALARVDYLWDNLFSYHSR